MCVKVQIQKRFISSSAIKSLLNFVPKHGPPTQKDIDILESFVSSHSSILVLTGAGVSTESGIPDYRSEGVGLYARSNRRPIKIQEFLSSPAMRKRYWARNFFGWPGFIALRPNSSHLTLRAWELQGKVNSIVTQNVDGLHKKAGSEGSIELHGTGHKVICLNCNWTLSRAIFQDSLWNANSHLRSNFEAIKIEYDRPDGDVDLEQGVADSFELPECPTCGGIVRPDIVFFGDNVPKQRVQKVYDDLESSDGLLVLGSSLQTFSAYRYILRGKELRKPILLVNLGPSRADLIVDNKIHCRIGELLPHIKLS